MKPELRRALEQHLGAKVSSTQAVGGGDINDAFCASVEGGGRVFVKSHPNPPPDMFSVEAKGLAWLRDASALRVPRVLATSDLDPAFLALEWIEPGPRLPEFEELVGRGLAELHRFGAPCFGLEHDNFIGRLEQRNHPHDDWASFYWQERLEPQLRLAFDARLINRDLRRQFDTLSTVLGDRVGPTEGPARLHGDLWGGNLHVDERGMPCLIDPAVYGGHREIDLAMMRLFGGFGRRVFEAYAEAWPLSAGSEGRVALYQLYPLLVHVNLFGAGYVPGVRSALQGSL